MIVFCGTCQIQIHCWTSDHHENRHQVRVNAMCHGKRAMRYIPRNIYKAGLKTDRKLVFFREKST